MGQKYSSSEVVDSEIAITNQNDLSSHFTDVMSKTNQADKCFNCGAVLEDNVFYSSGGKKSLGEVSDRCRQCRVNIMLEKFRAVITSSPRSIPILPSGSDAFEQSSQTCYHGGKPSIDTPNNSTVTITFTDSLSCV